MTNERVQIAYAMCLCAIVRAVPQAGEAVAAAVPSLTSLGSTELQQSGGRLTCLRILDVDCDEVRLNTALHYMRFVLYHTVACIQSCP
jgi:hypothetical protein